MPRGQAHREGISPPFGGPGPASCPLGRPGRTQEARRPRGAVPEPLLPRWPSLMWRLPSYHGEGSCATSATISEATSTGTSSWDPSSFLARGLLSLAGGVGSVQSSVHRVATAQPLHPTPATSSQGSWASCSSPEGTILFVLLANRLGTSFLLGPC